MCVYISLFNYIFIWKFKILKYFISDILLTQSPWAFESILTLNYAPACSHAYIKSARETPCLSPFSPSARIISCRNHLFCYLYILTTAFSGSISRNAQLCGNRQWTSRDVELFHLRAIKKHLSISACNKDKKGSLLQMRAWANPIIMRLLPKDESSQDHKIYLLTHKFLSRFFLLDLLIQQSCVYIVIRKVLLS